MGSIYLFCNVSDAVVFIFAQKWTESFYVSLACDKFNSDGVYYWDEWYYNPWVNASYSWYS